MVRTQTLRLFCPCTGKLIEDLPWLEPPAPLPPRPPSLAATAEADEHPSCYQNINRASSIS